LSTRLKSKKDTQSGVLFAFGRATRATDRVFLRHAQENRFGLPPQSASSSLVSSKASDFRACANGGWRDDANRKTRDFLGFSSFYAVFLDF